MAPEVVNRKGHTFAADWWSFGVLMVKKYIMSSCNVPNFLLFIVRNAYWQLTLPWYKSSGYNESNFKN